MPRLQSEYVLKGIFLGLVVYVATVAATAEPAPRADMGIVAACMLGGLGLALLVAGVNKLRQGFKVNGRWLPFILFLLLESPTLTYLGVLGGTLVGAFFIHEPNLEGSGFPSINPLILMVGAGIVFGMIFGQLAQIKDRPTRMGSVLLLGVLLVWGAVYLFGFDGKLPFLEPMQFSGAITERHPGLFALVMLLGAIIFYVLTFAGRAEETEVEIGVFCSALALALMMLFAAIGLDISMRTLAFVIPVLVFVLYTWRILPSLRVFKHVVRGFSFSQVARYRQALLAFRRAQELEPSNRLAFEGMWEVHQKIDVTRLADDPQLLALVDFDRCIERAGSLLLSPSPTEAKLHEAERLLGMVLHHRPDFRAKVSYWRAVAFTHARDIDGAAHELTSLLSGEDYAADDPQRQAILMAAWQLALVLHDGLRQRVGELQIAQPGRRMEAIAAVERHLGQYADDKDAWALKRVLYRDVREDEYNQAAGNRPSVPSFDHAHAQQLGLALLSDSQRWQRGCEYLRMAARGLPAMGPSIYIQVAKAYDRAGNPDEAWHSYELARHAGSTTGPKNLTDDDRHAYYAVVKMLGEEAMRQGKTDQAIEDFRLYSEYERAGIETMRNLATLYEAKGDAIAALHFTEMGLVYNANDRDLADRRDKYYYSINPEDLQRRLETYGGGLDFEYCLRKSKSLLDYRDADMEVIDWADHLIRLALAVKPESIRARLMHARALLRRGQRPEAVKILEELRSPRPEKFASGEDEEAWYVACQLLGRLYLDELGKPELALQCFQDFRQSPKSGADTMYRMGQAYERMGDSVKAIKCYEHVTSYEQHPLAPEAKSAIYRLQSGVSA